MCNKPLSTAAAMLGLRYSCGLLAIGRDIFWSALLSPICVFPPWDLCLTLRLALENHVFTFGNQKKSYSSQMICNGSFWHNSVFLSQINWNVSSYKGFSKFWQNCNLVSSYSELQPDNLWARFHTVLLSAVWMGRDCFHADWTIPSEFPLLSLATCAGVSLRMDKCFLVAETWK